MHWGCLEPRDISLPRPIYSHPSRGGSRGYNVARRAHILQLNHVELRNDPDAGVNLVGASDSSIYRWTRRLNPLEMNGNKLAMKIAGFDQFLLLFYRTVYPKATADEVRCFIFEYSYDPKIYSRPDISKAESMHLLTRKIGSKTAFQAFKPENVQRRWLYWNTPPPTGIIGVPIRQLVDIDEAGISLFLYFPQ